MALSRYVLSREAGRDLEEIEEYTAMQWGDKQAEKYLGDIFFAFDRLAENPNLGHSRQDVPHPYLAHAVGSHMIIYRYNNSARRIEVLNVVHPAMNISARMKEALTRMKKRNI
jgi:toxin ParE1/3/4